MEKAIYEVLENGYIKRTDPSGQVWTIPNDLSNSDYQQYLANNEAQAK